MARWTRDETLNQPEDFVQFLMTDFLSKNGFKRKTHKGEEVWQEGDGFITMARFIRYEYAEGQLHLEAWVGKRKEKALNGFVGALPKKMFRESLEELIRLLHQPLPQGEPGTMGNVVTIQVPDHSKYAIPAMILSILGIVIGLLLSPLFGILCGGLGMTFGQKAMNSSKNNLARASLILGIIAIVASIIGYIINLVLMFSVLKF